MSGELGSAAPAAGPRGSSSPAGSGRAVRAAGELDPPVMEAARPAGRAGGAPPWTCSTRRPWLRSTSLRWAHAAGRRKRDRARPIFGSAVACNPKWVLCLPLLLEAVFIGCGIHFGYGYRYGSSVGVSLKRFVSSCTSKLYN